METGNKLIQDNIKIEADITQEILTIAFIRMKRKLRLNYGVCNNQDRKPNCVYSGQGQVQHGKVKRQ